MPDATVITFGTFDVFHVGHLRLLKRAAALGSALVVGVSTDSLNFAKKQRKPIYPETQRLEIIASLRCVSEVFLERSLEAKADYIREHDAQILAMGDDWAGTFDALGEFCRVVYLPRTPSISTTQTIEAIQAGVE